ncbi:MAG: hypothetical protein V3W41_15700 [Planctomycetota bacterium]
MRFVLTLNTNIYAQGEGFLRAFAITLHQSALVRGLEALPFEFESLVQTGIVSKEQWLELDPLVSDLMTRVAECSGPEQQDYLLSTPFTSLSASRRAVNILSLSGRRHAENGDWDQATVDCEAALKVINLVAVQSHELINQLIADVCEQILVAHLQQISCYDGFRVEGFLGVWLQHLGRQPNRRAFFWRVWLEDLRWALTQFNARDGRSKPHFNLGDFGHENQDDLSAVLTSLQQVEAELENGPKALAQHDDEPVVRELFARGFQHVRDCAQRSQQRRTLTTAALALHSVAKARGKWPRSQEQLEALLVGPLEGQMLELHQGPKGLCLQPKGMGPHTASSDRHRRWRLE